ncbi:MAG: replication protein P [Pseudomonadota bacterium]
MSNSGDLIQQVAQEIEASKTTSPTPPGRSEEPRPATSEAHVEAINQIFALFRLNYHNQYYAAFPDAEQLNQLKKLWLDTLCDFPVAQILAGAKRAIKSSDYLPTLNRMLECCQQGLSEFGLPAPHDAYLEACSAASPRAAQQWSHPAVYLAGRDCGWYFLSNETQRVSWPIFRDCYQAYCTRVLRGDTLDPPEHEVLEQRTDQRPSQEAQINALRELRDAVDL